MRACSLELVQLRLERFGEAPAQRMAAGLGLAAAEALDRLIARSSLESNRNRPIDERVRQEVADPEKGLGAEDREIFQRRLVRAAHAIRDGAAPVAAFSIPRRSSRSRALKTASASSRSRVGVSFSTARKSAASEMFEA